ncbi:hypothetical protein [Clostridium estertheticum]|uniref:hypothetical protein n=1 Tax=Clostridium estertheticum TaxID=238834 RepID=UPI001C0AAB43|nr:hypothetical protein [Clostridium estertheticum]MBU3173346.1 hypothetical protein [Clostridium estertheticum]
MNKKLKWVVCFIISFIISNVVLFLGSTLIFGSKSLNYFMSGDEMWQELIYIVLVLGTTFILMKLVFKVKISLMDADD